MLAKMAEYGPPKILSSVKAMRKLGVGWGWGMIRINFFRILEINQRLTTIQGMFIQEKWLNPSKNSELCGILTCPVPTPL